MVQIVPKQGNIFGRIGAGIGQGLAEQLPKEIERGRLAQGLQQFEQESANLNPMQSLARLAAIPGITPQMIQSFGELARQQGVKNAFAQGLRSEAKPKLTSEKPSQMISEVPFAPTQRKGGNRISEEQVRGRPTQDVVRPEEQRQPQAAKGSPLREEVIPARPFTPEERDAELGKIFQQFPWMTPEQAQERLADTERRMIAQSEASQKQDIYREEQARKIDDTLTKRLELLTHKKGDDLFKDISGEMQNNFRRTVEKDLDENPKLTLEDAVNKRADQLLRLVKTKGEVQALSGRDFDAKITPSKKKQTLEQLLSASQRFDDLGNNEEYFNLLRSSPENGGFGLSPAKAAWIAYPRNKTFNKFINSVEPTKLGSDRKRTAKYYASQIAKIKEPNDSILSMYQELKRKDPRFDHETFFNELRNLKNQKELFDPRDELVIGEQEILPNWGDLFLFPIEGEWL